MQNMSERIAIGEFLNAMCVGCENYLERANTSSIKLVLTFPCFQ